MELKIADSTTGCQKKREIDDDQKLSSPSSVCPVTRHYERAKRLRKAALAIKMPNHRFGGLQIDCEDEGYREMSDSAILKKRLRSALSKLHFCYKFHGFFQFWAPVQVGRRRLLMTSGQPFAFSPLGSSYERYRSCCLKYQYDIDVNVNHAGVPNPNIIRGIPARAFVNGLPEFDWDFGSHRIHEGPLVRAALDCGLRASFVVPIFSDASQSCCVGVLECCIEECEDSWRVLWDLNDALKARGLCLFNAEAHISSKLKNVCHLEDATNEIEEALQVIMESHRAELVQAWIAYGDEYHDASSSSKKRMVGCRLAADRCIIDPPESCVLYYEHCCSTPFINGNAPVVSCSEGDDDESICFAILLENDKTHDMLYALEIHWKKTLDCTIMLESLNATIKTFLPGFKIASRADEFASSSKNPDVCVSGWKAHSRWQVPFYKKIKVSHMDRYGTRATPINPIRKTIKVEVEYDDELIKFDLPLPIASARDVEKPIEEGFNLDPGTYQLKCCNQNGEWIPIAADVKGKRKRVGRSMIAWQLRAEKC